METNLEEAPVLGRVLADLGHPGALHGVQLAREVGEVHGRVELPLQQRVEAVLRAQRAVLHLVEYRLHRDHECLCLYLPPASSHACFDLSLEFSNVYFHL